MADVDALQANAIANHIVPMGTSAIKFIICDENIFKSTHTRKNSIKRILFYNKIIITDEFK